MTTEEICEKYYITNYSINPDGSIDVNGDVNLCNKKLTELPLVFNKVSGSFDCGDNQLTSLRSCPRWVGGYFHCHTNNLTSLEFSPEYIGDGFDCSNNYLTDLTGSPKEVRSYFGCEYNPELINPKGCSEKIGSKFYCGDTPLSSIFDDVDQHFLYTFNFYRIIKDKTVNLKRLRYVMDLYDQPIDLEKIKKYYKLV
jgi:hypothetical protein